MRREMFRSEREHALALLARAPTVHLAMTDPEGNPIGRTVHGVIVGDFVCFHGAPAGEKLDAIGRPVVLWCEEVVAEVPSWFSDPKRACPATTLYESVQVHGVLEQIDAPDAKAQALQALMEKFQPEGRHVPITADDPLYKAAVKGILILGVRLDRVDGKSKLAQNKSAAERATLVQRLWERGRPGDPRAVQLILAANPDTPPPAFLSAPAGVTLSCAVGPDRAAEVARLLADTYWNVGIPEAAIAAAHLNSPAWVGAFDSEGALVGSARALGDGAKWATIYDVIVAPSWRGRGVGQALVRLILDHPAVRGARKVNLRTRDAQGLYSKFGFFLVGSRPIASSVQSVEMGLVRSP
jgi:ribosomal protein S18 acetylase RimI-like enzyme/nitroimidazol reductase NimA-like FMN-containing flavoprotein (pyridoxamine 5'-phosphate oxidase superfamily)